MFLPDKSQGEFLRFFPTNFERSIGDVVGRTTKPTNLKYAPFVIHSLCGSYGDGSICPKTDHGAYRNLLKSNEDKLF
jgi:hypothetical protein